MAEHACRLMVVTRTALPALALLSLCWAGQCHCASAQAADKADKSGQAEKAGKVEAAGKNTSATDKAVEGGKNTTATADLGAKVDPAKKAAIKELLDLTKMSEKTSSMRDVMLASVRRTINFVLQKSIADDVHYSDSQKKQMLDTLSDSSDRIINRYRELSSERINMPAIMEQVAYKVYDESFTTSELQDLIAFYRTPTGQKALKEMPEIMQRSMTLSSQLIQPKVLDIIKELTSEEFARLKRDATTSSTSSQGHAAAATPAAMPTAATPVATPAATPAPAPVANPVAAPKATPAATGPSSSGPKVISPSK